MIRTFVALEIPPDVLSSLAALLKSKLVSYERINFEPVSKLHVTLKFIGDIEREIVDPLSNELEPIISNRHKLNLEFSNFGFFKSSGVERIFWAGLKKNPEIELLAAEIDELCFKYGVKKETRSFHAHITLVRIKDRSQIHELKKAKELDITDLKFCSEKIIFFESQLKPGGSVYKPIKSFLLKEEIK